MRILWRRSILPAACFFLSGSLLLGQPGAPRVGSGLDNGLTSPATYGSNGSVLMLTVLGENKARLDRQAVAKLSNETVHTAAWQTTGDNGQANFGDLAVGRY